MGLWLLLSRSWSNHLSMHSLWKIWSQFISSLTSSSIFIWFKHTAQHVSSASPTFSTISPNLFNVRVLSLIIWEHTHEEDEEECSSCSVNGVSRESLLLSLIILETQKNTHLRTAIIRAASYIAWPIAKPGTGSSTHKPIGIWNQEAKSKKLSRIFRKLRDWEKNKRERGKFRCAPWLLYKAEGWWWYQWWWWKLATLLFFLLSFAFIPLCFPF